MDKIIISDLLLRCIIGVYDFERREKQDVLINIVLFTNTKKAGKLDDINYAIDYKAVTKKVINMVLNSKFFLVEALAENIATICLESEKVEKVLVKVEKPGALRFSKKVGVEIIRDKPKFRDKSKI